MSSIEFRKTGYFFKVKIPLPVSSSSVFQLATEKASGRRKRSPDLPKPKVCSDPDPLKSEERLLIIKNDLVPLKGNRNMMMRDGCF